jgi:hypothetical protein
MWVECRQQPSSCGLYSRTNVTNFVGKPDAVPRDIFEQRSKDLACDRIKVTSKGLAAQPERLQRYRTSASKWINDEWRLVGISSFHKIAPSREKSCVSGVVPVGEVTDKPEKPLPQAFITVADVTRHRV